MLGIKGFISNIKTANFEINTKQQRWLNGAMQHQFVMQGHNTSKQWDIKHLWQIRCDNNKSQMSRPEV